MITPDKGYDLTSPATQRHPQPNFVDPEPYERPQFIQFERITRLCRLQGLLERRKGLGFFKPLGQRLAGYTEDAFDAAHARSFKIDFENGLALFGGIALLGIEGAVLATGFAVKLGIIPFCFFNILILDFPQRIFPLGVP